MPKYNIWLKKEVVADNVNQAIQIGAKKKAKFDSIIVAEAEVSTGVNVIGFEG